MDWTQRQGRSLSRASGESGRGSELTGGHEKVSVSDFEQIKTDRFAHYTHITYHVPGIRKHMIHMRLFVKGVLAPGVSPGDECLSGAKHSKHRHARQKTKTKAYE